MARRTVYVCGITSLVLLIASIVLLVAHTFMDMVETKIKKETVLKNTSEVFKDWADPPPPIYMKFYFFDVINPMEVLAGEKPFVRELGPYVYREYRPKENIEFLENGTEVSAINPKTYVFEPELSKGNPKTDIVRTINIPIVTLMEMVKNSAFSTIISAILKAALRTYNEAMFMNRTVHELLWGYKDPILSLVHTAQRNISDTFGLFYNMNTTNDGTYVFLSGADNYLDFSRIVEWNGKRNLTWWTSEASNMINGTDGTSFHPLIDKEDVLYMFSSDLCRSMYVVYESAKSVKGISTFRFVPPAKVFANVSINPDNAGFCVPKGNCLPSGLLNISQCKEGAPIILSSPHFYQAEEFVINSIEGMHPNKDDHETFLDINPLTGLLLGAAKRMQVNVYVTKIPEFRSVTQEIQTLYFPVMHLSEDVVIDENSSKRLQIILLEARIVANIPFMIMGVGILFGAAFVFLVCRTNRTREEDNQDEPLIRA